MSLISSPYGCLRHVRRTNVLRNKNIQVLIAGITILGMSYVILSNIQPQVGFFTYESDEVLCVSKKPLVYETNTSFTSSSICSFLSRGVAESKDRLIKQLHLGVAPNKKSDRTKIILQYTDFHDETGSGFFEKHCMVKNCTLSKDRSLMTDDSVHVDAVMFGDGYYGGHLPEKKNGQIWAMFMLESPLHTRSLIPFGDQINWTLTYRVDSTIVTPYFKYAKLRKTTTAVTEFSKRINYAEGKSRIVAWFVSNCFDKNGRLEYVRELQQYIKVDIYGSCGPYKCPKSQDLKCNQRLRADYKFYLAFENSNCKDYITEKPVDHALKLNLVPIVMGASAEAYKRTLPPNSYLHVDNFTSPKELAKYLEKVHKDDELYNEYFKWKNQNWRIIKTDFLCRMCAMLHRDLPPIWYPDVHSWWTENACGTWTASA